MPANLMIIQGGGPTAVFNASLFGIVDEALRQPKIGKIFGARSGMRGLSSGEFVELSALAPATLAALCETPGAALGSSRFKPTDDDLAHCLAHLKRLEVRHLIFMGGNGTMRGAHLFGRLCGDANFEIQIIGVPKTIDNDIAATDRCPGFGSAARFVAQSTLDLSMDIRSLPQPVSIFETLGRDVGWLSAAAALARRESGDPPHLIYLPEIPFSVPAFLSDLDAVVTRVGWAVVVVSEGIANPDGTPVFEQTIPTLAEPPHTPANRATNRPPNRPLIGGVAQHLSGVVAQHLDLRCRSEKPGLIGRSSMAHVSPQDREDAIIVGREGVRALISGETGHMVALRGLPLSAAGACHLIDLRDAAGASRRIPPHWLTSSNSTVTQEFLDYARPIVGKLAHYTPIV